MRFCPVEYNILKASSKGMRRVDANLIEALAYRSDNPRFKTNGFRRALIKYREYGCKKAGNDTFDVEQEVADIKEALEFS